MKVSVAFDTDSRPEFEDSDSRLAQQVWWRMAQAAPPQEMQTEFKATACRKPPRLP